MNLQEAIEHMRRFRCCLVTDSATAKALAVCLEALAEHAHDGGAILREVNPKAYSPIDTTKSAPPLTPKERPHSCLACNYEATRAVNRNEPPLRLLATCPKVDPRIREDASKRLGRRKCSCNRSGTCYACMAEGTG